MNKLNFEDLKIFVALYELKSFSKAAVVLHLSQSALSKRIQHIEAILGSKLVDTSNHRRMLVTEAGERFFFHASKILHQVELMNTDLNSLKSLSNGVLTIGAVPILGQFGISRLINDFAAQFPKLALHVVEQEGNSILKQLLTGDLDMALLRDTQAEVLSTREYVKLDLAKDELQVILAKTNPLAKRPSLSAKDLAATTIVSLLSGSGVFEPMQAFFADRHIAPKIIFSSPHIETLLGMVEGSRHVTFLFRQSYQPFANSNFVAKSLTPNICSHLQLVYRRTSNPAILKFADYLSQQVTAEKG